MHSLKYITFSILSIVLFSASASVALAAAPTVSLTPPSSTVTAGTPITLHWSSTNAVSCTSPDFNTGGATSGDVTITPHVSKTYSITCSGAQGAGWSLTMEDWTDYACILGPEKNLTDPNLNGLNKAYQNKPNCNISDPQGHTCAAEGAVCKVNSGQCVIHTELYTCTAGASTDSAATASATTDVTVTLPPITTPAPTCTLDAQPNPINQGGNSVLSWTISNATSYVTSNFTIPSSTPTPQTVVADCSSIGYQYQDCPLNVPIASVQSISVVQQYSYCNKMSPYDCTPMPGTNYGVTNGNHLWVDKGYRARFSITYIPTSSFPTSGSVTVSPPSTTTYRMTVTGPGGTGQCQEILTVNPLPQCRDNADNDGDHLVDEADPGCHTDGNPGNHSSYTPNDNDETDSGTIHGCKLTLKKEIVNGAGTHLQPGDLVEYKITVKNIGDQNCTGGGVQITDMLQSLLTFVDSGHTHSSNIDEGYNGQDFYTASDRTLRWNANVLTPGEDGWVKFKARVGTPSQCTSAIFNKAKVSADQYNNFHDWEDSNTVTVGVEKPDCGNPPVDMCPNIPGNQATVPAGKHLADGQCVPDTEPEGCKLEITKTLIGNDHVGINDRVHYRITFKNTGDRDCTGGGVKIMDTLDPGLTFYPLLAVNSPNVNKGYNGELFYTPSDRTLRWNANVLSPGEDGFVEFRADVNTPSSCSATVPNKARISADQYDNFNTWVYSNTVNVTVTKDNCTPPTDVCPNIEGTQASIPVGYQKVDGQCILIPTTSGPVCHLSISANEITTGGSVKISWTSSNATTGSIDNNVGNVTPVAGGTTDDLFPPSSTTYVGTFGNGTATTTCSVGITVRPGSRGCQGSCGGGLDQATVTLTGQPGDQPLAFVSLAQVPYTGFAAGPMLTFIFWLAVALWSAGITYVVVGKGSLRLLISHLAFAGAQPMRRHEEVVREDEPEGMSLSTLAMPMPSAAVMPMPAATIAHAPAPAQVAAPAEDGIPALTDVIESRAHAAGVLLSPEAVQMAATLSDDRAEALRAFGDILNEAVRTVPREDGWILLSSDRFKDLAGQHRSGGTNDVETAVTPVTSPAVNDAMAESVTTRLAAAIVTGDRDGAFAIIRGCEKEGVHATSLMTGVAAALDRLYRARTGGTAPTDMVLADKASALSDEALHAVLEVMAHALDSAYESPYTGVKLAVAQAFETL